MLPLNSSPRFSARSQTKQDGLSSGSWRSVDCEAPCPWNTATRRHDRWPLRSEHFVIVPLSLILRRAALEDFLVSAATDPALRTRPATMSKADRRMGNVG